MPKIVNKSNSATSLNKLSLSVSVKRKKLNIISVSISVYEKYSSIKTNLSYKSDDDFVSYLLSFIDKETRSNTDGSTNCNPSDEVKTKPFKPFKKIIFDNKITNVILSSKNIDDESSNVKEDVKKTKKCVKSAVNKNKSCSFCESKHSPKVCPMLSPEIAIDDSISKQDWLTKRLERSEPSKLNIFMQNNSKENLDSNIDEDVKPKCVMTYSEASLPKVLKFAENDKGISVLTKALIKKHARLGPLVATSIKETDIPDDCSMDKIWEIYINDEDKGCKKLYFNLESTEDTNWFRYLSPAASKAERNCNVLMIDDKIYIITCKDVQQDEELLYWIDDVPGCWSKKKLEKINCGGCNLKFAHVLHYRTHCSVFHDPAFSLTIRKYHCKVCGEAVLGKENIMRHAADKHDGKGAYQCQYCKKFFLRLNYLEMHRTYGCSMNPQRARPLCDHCGREFCQPQKLKVHIQRMHSDMADVLRDFQCKLCSKILGSRAALQRHHKEVHHSQDGNNQQSQNVNPNDISCSRCGKTFQNKSNLKIHMLTHSGVKPFKCLEGDCKSAFTTKQCLQFHYKKVHGYMTQNEMPKIERSVAYTFDAYAGENDHIKQTKKQDTTKSENMPHNIENLVDIKNSSSSSSNASSDSYTEAEIITHMQQYDDNNQQQLITNDEIDRKIEYANYNRENKEGVNKSSADTDIDDNFHENIYVYEHPASNEENSNIILDVVEGNSESMELDRITVMASSDEHNINIFNANRVPSRASMLVEAALDSVDKNTTLNFQNHIDIDEYGMNLNRTMNHYITSDDKHDLDIDDISRNLQMASSPSNNMMNESEIDVSSLDGRGTVDNYHDFSLKHNQMKSDANQQSDEDNHYQMQHDAVVSPVATPIPRYDFNTHHNITNDLSSDDEGIAQNLTLNLKVDRYQNASSYITTTKSYEIPATNNQDLDIRSKYEAMLENDFRNERNSFDPISELQGLDMTSRHQTYPNFQNRFHPMHHHHLYDVTSVMTGERQSVDLTMARNDLNLSLNRNDINLSFTRNDLLLNRSDRDDIGLTSLTPLNNSGTPSYTDVLRAAVSLDLTNGRHGVDAMGLPRALHHHHASTGAPFSDVTHHAASRLLAAEHTLTANRLLPDPVHLLLDHHSHHHHHHMSHHRLLSSPPSSSANVNAPTVDVVDVSPRMLQCPQQSTNQDVSTNQVGLGPVSPPRGVFSNYQASGFQLTQTTAQNVVGVGVNGGAAFHPYSAGGYY